MMLESIRTEYDAMHLGSAAGRGLLIVLLFPFWLLGWLVGLLWRCIVWLAAAVVAGFKTGAADALRKREGKQQ